VKKQSNNGRQYLAFISYSHSDEKFAKKLHNALETYKVPKKIQHDYECPDRLYPIFRDKNELPTSATLTENISAALKNSKSLIVICSPNSAKSRWVNEEIRQFKALGKESQILACIIDGEPNATDKNNVDSIYEAFPEALRFKLGEGGILSNEKLEPIAADMRLVQQRNSMKQKANTHQSYFAKIFELSIEEEEKLRLISGILNVPYYRLNDREKKRKKKKYTQYILQIFLLFLITIGLLLFGFYQIKKNNRLLIDKGHKALKSKNWNEAFLYFKESLESISTTEAKVGISIANHYLLPEVFSMSDPSGKVTSLAFSNDSNLLAVGGKNGSIRILNILDGSIMEMPKITKDEGDITSIVFSKDQKYIVSGSKYYEFSDGTGLIDSGTLKMCDVKKQTCDILYRGREIEQVFVNEEKSELVVINDRNEVMIYSLLTKKLLKKISVDSSNVASVFFENKEDNEIVACKSGELVHIDLNTLKIKSKSQLPMYVDNILKYNNRKLLGYRNNNLFIFTGKKSGEYAVFDSYSHESNVTTLDVSSNGRFSASGSGNGVVKIIEYGEHRNYFTTVKTNTKAICAINFSYDEKLMAVAGGDNRFAIYELPDKTKIDGVRVIPHGWEDELYGDNYISVSCDNRFIATTKKIYDIKNKTFIEIDILGDKYDVFLDTIKFNIKSTKVAYVFHRRNKCAKIRVINLKNNDTWDMDIKSGACDVSLHPSKDIIALVEYNSVFFYEQKRHNKLKEKDSLLFAEPIISISFDTSGENLYIISETVLYKYNLLSKDLIELFDFPELTLKKIITFQDDNRIILTVDNNKKIIIFEDGQSPIYINGHFEDMFALKGNVLVTKSEPFSDLELWDIKQKKHIETIQGNFYFFSFQGQCLESVFVNNIVSISFLLDEESNSDSSQFIPVQYSDGTLQFMKNYELSNARAKKPNQFQKLNITLLKNKLVSVK